MKQLFLTLILLLAVAANRASAEGTSTSKGGTATNVTATVIVNGSDSVVPSEASEALAKKLSNKIIKHSINAVEHLDDTLVDASGAVSASVDNEDEDDEKNWTWIETNRIWGQRVSEIALFALTAIVIIVVFMLFFRYLNRHRKYKVIEKAIEFNYPLPDGIFGNNTTRVVYTQPAPPVIGTPTPPPFNQGSKTDGQPDNGAQQAQSQGQAQTLKGQTFSYYADRINWHEIKGVTLTIVSLCAIIFFLVTDGEPVAVLCGIPLLIGISKMFTSYMDQRNAINAARYWQQPVQEQPSAQPEQANQAEQSMPEPPQL